VPFVDERDHLGQLIDSDVRTELGGNSYIKRNLHFQPRKNTDKIEIRDDIPRRWLEQVGGQSEAMSAQQNYRRLSINSAPFYEKNDYHPMSTKEGSQYAA
jgi:hypothetical protein